MQTPPRALRPFLSCVAATAALLPAQTWVETGDAGASLATAQAAYGADTFGFFTQISGSLQGDVDMYVIQITDPAAFTAIGQTNPNYSLYLFDEQGRGITGCEDTSAGNPVPSLSGVSIPGPGRYYLAVAVHSVRPVSALGLMWAPSFVGEAKPLGAGGREPLVGWTGANFASGSYGITLSPYSTRRVLRQLQLPGDHHLSESPTVQGTVGSTAYWPVGGGRFQILYEGAELLAAGITGPIVLNRLGFRAEDGEVNLGGIEWSYYASFSVTSLTPATMSTTFATNLDPATTTNLGGVSTTATLGRAIGSTPNNTVLEVDGPSFFGITYDPTGARPNLLVDVNLGAATVPAGALMVAMQDTTGSNLRGRGLVANGTSATTGTLASPLAIALEYTPVSGPSAPPLVTVLQPARNERFGAACGGDPASFYEAFLRGQAFDLNGFTMTPDNAAAPTSYTVTRNAFPLNTQQVNAVPNSVADDAVVTRPLGFTFRFPGGNTTSIGACTNGYLWLDGATTGADFSPTTAEFLGQTGNLPARLAPCWYDFHCGRNPGFANSGLHVRTDTSGGPGNAVCYITWYRVGVFNSAAQSGTAVHDMQCVLHEATGVVEFRYLSMPRYCANTSTNASNVVPALVGFTRGFRNGAPSVDPQSRDLSIEMPFTTGADTVGNIGLSCVTSAPSSGTSYGGRLYAGQQAQWRVDNVPAGTMVGVQLLALATSRPGLQLPGITAPGCGLGTGLDVVLWEAHLFPASTVTGTASLLIPSGVEGAQLTAQYVVLGGLFGAPDLVTMTSQALLQTVGRQ